MKTRKKNYISLDDALVILESEAEQAETRGEYWEEYETDDKITLMDCYKVIKKELGR